MGFFSSLIKGVVSVGRGLLGIPAAAAPVARAAIRVAPRAAVAVGAGALGLGAGALAFGGDDGGAVGGMGGNGSLMTRTIVQTLDREGTVVRQRVERGSPFLMNRDLAIAKRVIRTVSRLGGKFKRTKVGPSKMKQLTDKIVDSAICNVATKALAPC